MRRNRRTGKPSCAELNAREGAAYSFEKHISFHFAFAPDFGWLDDARIFHLIRDPRAMVASYKNKLDDVAPIIDSYRIQRRLYELRPAPVIDAAGRLKSAGSDTARPFALRSA